jgi:transcriptional regulator with XRE-family HTH domain
MRATHRKPVNDPVIDRIIDTLKVRNISQKELIEHLGLTNGAFTRWKYNGGKSYMDYIDEIANYLHISKAYLLYGEHTDFQEVSLLPSEIEIYKKLRRLTESQRNIVFDLINEFSCMK